MADDLCKNNINNSFANHDHIRSLDKAGLASSVYFFIPLTSRDTTTRSEALEAIGSAFDSWLDEYKTSNSDPVDEHVENNVSNHDSTTNHVNDLDEQELINLPSANSRPKLHALHDQIPNLLRHSHTCPYKDVREKCTSLLNKIKESGIQIPYPVSDGPSLFIPSTKILPVDTDDEETQSLFVEAFLQNNRLEHMVQVMGYHPQYLEHFLRTQHYMLRGDGPLSYDYRHYIAIMASGRHESNYLVKLHCTEFLLQGGDEEWLQGLDRIPKKLKDLYELNKLMAHRPWLINKSHIEKLTRGNDNWSISELMHACVLLAHFHALSSFVNGCGIQAEIDQDSGHTYDPNECCRSPNIDKCQQCSSANSHSTSPNSFKLEGLGMIETLMKKMRELTEEEPEETTQEEMLKRFQKVENQSAELLAMPPKPSRRADIERFVKDPDFVYQDFVRRGEISEIPTFRIQDFSWEEHGFSLANRLYTDIGSYLDDKFNVAYNLTYNTMGDNDDVDTSSFRRAIWNYIHCMFGIRHDDYDYGEVNVLLERSLKSFIKTVTCYPERITKKEYDSFMHEFKHSEKVHVNLMLMEARIQAELLYALRAITRHMT